MRTIINITSLPVNLIIGNTTDHAVELPLYPDNSTLTLNPEDQIIYQVATSREYVYYYTTCRGLTLSMEEQSE